MMTFAIIALIYIVGFWSGLKSAFAFEDREPWRCYQIAGAVVLFCALVWSTQ